MSKIVIIAGMHRSGTSLTANWLHNAGISMGDALLEEAYSNIAGHYEDKDFYHFHKDLLVNGNQNYLICSDDALPKIAGYWDFRARSIVAFKSDLHDQWGWKDPRTCLFLPYWKSVCPSALYLIVYRDYRNSVDSLLRRQLDRPRKKIDLMIRTVAAPALHFKRRKLIEDSANIYLKTWNFYNQKLIEFLVENPGIKALCIEDEDILNNSSRLEEWLAESGFAIRKGVFREVYRPQIKKSKLKYFREELFPTSLLEMSEKIFGRLKELQKSAL